MDTTFLRWEDKFSIRNRIDRAGCKLHTIQENKNESTQLFYKLRYQAKANLKW